MTNITKPSGPKEYLSILGKNLRANVTDTTFSLGDMYKVETCPLGEQARNPRDLGLCVHAFSGVLCLTCFLSSFTVQLSVVMCLCFLSYFAILLGWNVVFIGFVPI
jgi:hypothetical protein